MLLKDLFQCFASENAMTAEHAIEHCPKGVYIGVSINSVAENLLGCRSAGSVHAIYTPPAIGRGELRSYFKDAHHSKICDEQGTILLNENAVRC